jgi:hypothetical protein
MDKKPVIDEDKGYHGHRDKQIINHTKFTQIGLCSGTETSALLPPLPVPELDKTIQKFLAFAKPIQPANEYAQTVKVAFFLILNIKLKI